MLVNGLYFSHTNRKRQMKTLMQQMIERADANAPANNQYGGAVEVTNAGEVRLYRDYKIGSAFGGNRRHARSNWRLNGVTISAAKLADLLK